MPSSARACFAVISSGLLFGVLGACASKPAPPPDAPVFSPLPRGWAWPASQAAAARNPQRIYRPVHVEALAPLPSAPSCAFVQVAPSVWARALCSALPRLTSSPQARALATPLATVAPSGVDLRALGLDGPVKDQQAAGVCWSFAISTLLDNALRRAGRGDVLAPLHIVADDEFHLLYSQGNGRPLVLEPSWPYDPKKACKLDDNTMDRSYCEQAYNVDIESWQKDPSLSAERARAESSGVYRIVSFQTLKASPGDPDQVAKVLAGGQAIYGGFDIDIDAWSSLRHAPGAVIPDWQPSSSGGHAVALVGYRTSGSGRQFLVHNSWGTDWGDQGYAWISEAMISQRMHDAFVITAGDSAGRPIASGPPPIPTGTTAPPPTSTSTSAPPPAPPFPLPFPFPFPFPFPTPSATAPPPAAACPSGQLRDLLFGGCVAPCGSGGAPIAGLCAGPGGGSTPTPGTPGAGACPKGQLADLLTGQCEPPCPHGAARAAGICWM